MKRSDKKKIQYSLVCITIALILVFIITHYLQNKIESDLAEQVNFVLHSYEEDAYTILEPIIIENNLSNMGAFYTVETLHREVLYASIIRIMGINGPFSAVFLYSDTNTNFIGTTGITSSIYSDRHGLTDSQISYWENKITQIFLEHLQQEDIE